MNPKIFGNTFLSKKCYNAVLNVQSMFLLEVSANVANATPTWSCGDIRIDAMYFDQQTGTPHTVCWLK